MDYPRDEESYTELYNMGIAHSIEAWEDDILVGGLYGVCIGNLFAGESMFAKRSDASKVAFVYAVHQMIAWGIENSLTVRYTQIIWSVLEQKRLSVQSICICLNFWCMLNDQLGNGLLMMIFATILAKKIVVLPVFTGCF